MKFGKFLLASRVVGWEDYYLDYKILKQAIQAEGKPNRDEEEGGSGPRKSTSPLNSFFRNQAAESGDDMEPLLDGPDGQSFLEHFVFQIQQVNRHWQLKFEQIRETNRTIRRETERSAAITSFQSLDADSVMLLKENQKEAIQLALRELYQECLTLKQVSGLNFTGFTKAWKKYLKIHHQKRKDWSFHNDWSMHHDRARDRERSLHERPASVAGNNNNGETLTPSQASQQSASGVATLSETVETLQKERFYQGIKEVDHIALRIEEFFASLYTNGDRLEAQRRLRYLHCLELPSKILVGWLLGACSVTVLFIIYLWGLPHKDKCPYCPDTLDQTIPVYRVLFMPVLWLWFWSVCCYVWKRHAINYPFMLEMNPYTELGWDRVMRLAALLSLALLLDFAIFLGAVKTGYTPFGVEFRLIPMGVLLFGLFSWIAPKGSFHYKSRRYFLRVVFRTLAAPWCSVRFMDNFIADVFTSLAVWLRDVNYAVQFYLSGAYRSQDVMNPLHASFWLSAPIITALPFWFRLQQCLRRYHDTAYGHPSRKFHLVNAVKYLGIFSSQVIAAVFNFTSVDFAHISDWDTPRKIWFGVLTWATLYAYVWDLTMDAGLFEKIPEIERKGRVQAFFPYRLRTNRIFPWTWFYIWVGCFDLFGRLCWALSLTASPYIFAGIPKGVTVTVIALVELFRRFQLSILRVEYEYVSNTSYYRSIKDVPMLLNSERYTKQDERNKKVKNGAFLSSALLILSNLSLTAICLVAIIMYNNRTPPHPAPAPTPVSPINFTHANFSLANFSFANA